MLKTSEKISFFIFTLLFLVIPACLSLNFLSFSQEEATVSLTEYLRAGAAPAGVLPEALPSSSAQKYCLEVEIALHNRGDTPVNNIRLEVPLMGNLDSTYQVLVQEKYNLEPLEIVEEAMASRKALFCLDSLPAGASKSITLQYLLAPAPPSCSGSFLNDSLLAQYLQPSSKIESDHPFIISKAAKITAGALCDEEKARRIYASVLDHMTYNLDSPHRNQGALSALQNGSGVCEDYASLFVALSRAAGIPARQVYGYADPGATGEIWKLAPGQAFSLRGCRHSWAEIYLAGRGWLPVDPTMEICSKSFQFFGFLPGASHIAQNYLDNSLKARFNGGQLEVLWSETLVGKEDFS